MSDAPERMWVVLPRETGFFEGRRVEYVRTDIAEAKLEQYKSAITYAAIVVDQVANDEDVDPNALMAALLEIEVVAPKKLEE